MRVLLKCNRELQDTTTIAIFPQSNREYYLFILMHQLQQHVNIKNALKLGFKNGAKYLMHEICTFIFLDIYLHKVKKVKISNYLVGTIDGLIDVFEANTNQINHTMIYKYITQSSCYISSKAKY